jgi:hypothetical protein
MTKIKCGVYYIETLMSQDDTCYLLNYSISVFRFVSEKLNFGEGIREFSLSKLIFFNEYIRISNRANYFILYPFLSFDQFMKKNVNKLKE